MIKNKSILGMYMDAMKQNPEKIMKEMGND